MTILKWVLQCRIQSDRIFSVCTSFSRRNRKPKKRKTAKQEPRLTSLRCWPGLRSTAKWYNGKTFGQTCACFAYNNMRQDKTAEHKTSWLKTATTIIKLNCCLVRVWATFRRRIPLLRQKRDRRPRTTSRIIKLNL